MKKRQYTKFKNAAITLRRQGRTYSDICNELGLGISQSTLCLWLHDVQLSPDERERLKNRTDEKLAVARERAIITNQGKREARLQKIRENTSHFSGMLTDECVAKIVLAMLYWCEGGKNGSSLAFGNSDPIMIKLFLRLLRRCYRVDERKLRGCVQCRADQDVEALGQFWSEVTDIPCERFTRPKIDPRTIGKPTQNLSYKGVLRIDYFSADLYNEIIELRKILTEGL